MVTLRYTHGMISPNTGDIPRVGLQVPFGNTHTREIFRVAVGFCEVTQAAGPWRTSGWGYRSTRSSDTYSWEISQTTE